MNKKPLLAVLALALGAVLGTGRAEAHLRPSTDLLLPYFEVDLGAGGMTTLVGLTNSSEQSVSAVATLYTNWGIAVLDVPLAFGPRQVRTANLRDWIVGGTLPAGTLSAAQLAVLQANLTGQRSPDDSLYYATAVAAGRAAGYVIVRVAGPQGALRPALLWGDSFTVDSGQDVAWGGPLVDIGESVGCPDLCNRHGLRFLSGAAFDGGTQVVIWTPRQGQPSARPDYPESALVQGTAELYDEAGKSAGAHAMSLLPVERIAIADLGASAPFGWLDLGLETGAFVGVRYDAHKRYAIALETDCLETKGKVPGLSLRKLTNGSHDDVPPGASLPVGSPIAWRYVVRNTGQVPLTAVAVSDDRGVAVTCPKTALDPGEEMACSGAGTAVACQYHNVGTAVATPPDGPQLVAQDDGYYVGDAGAAIRLALATNGQHATAPPGGEVQAGSRVTWTYLVTNTGRAALASVAVQDDHGAAVACPRTTLAPGAAMTCTATGTAVSGAYHNVGTATGAGPCGSVQSHDDGYYHTSSVPPPHLKIEKRTNGQRVAAAPGPSIPVGSPVTWSYVVTNDGGVALSNLRVTDDRGVAVSCPRSTLQPGEAMTCSGSGRAVACQYSNTGTVVGTAPSVASPLSDHDESWYFGAIHPAVAIEKYTNGQRVAAAPGPTLAVGSAVTWTYRVTNAGDSPLANVRVSDDRHVAVACPKSALQPGESMTCSAHGTAVSGQYRNVGTATGQPPCGNAVSASDSSYYYGGGSPGSQGCSPGYWKNHPASWPPTGYATGQTVASVFSQSSTYPSAGPATLLQALSFSGGPTVEDGARLLAHHGVAALLNAADAHIAFPLLPADVVSQVNAALASGDRDAMLALASRLDADNNLGCPLN